MSDNLYESASPEMLDEIIREAESLLDEQLEVAIAADQRALTFAGLLVAAVAALIGAVASLGGRASAVTVALATVFALAAGSALWSARPTAWRFRGNAPHEWTRDIIGERDLRLSRAEMAAHYDKAAYENHLALERAAWAMRVSLALTGLGLAAALVWGWVLVLR